MKKQQNEPNIFDIDNKHDLFYLLGLIFTDGNLDNLEQRITLSLTDKKIIEYLYPLFSSNDRKIYEYKPKAKNANKIYTIINESNITITKLKEMGFQACNSTTKDFPDIPEKYIWDFIRGVFDGDGCIYNSNYNKKYKKLYKAISITCASKSFIYQLKNIFESLGFHPTIVIDSRRKEQNIKTYYLKINRQQEIKMIFKEMYKNATIKNNTKYRKFCYEDIV